LCFGEFGAQALDAAADDHQQIVEVVRDAAGQLADRFQPLRLAQRAFRRLAAVGLVVKPLRAPQRQPEADEQKSRGRQPKDQMAHHITEPLMNNRRLFDAGQHIERIAGELAIADAAVDVIDLGVDRVDITVEPALDALAERAVLVELNPAVLHQRITREEIAIGAGQGEIAALASHAAIKAFEIARQDGDRHNTVEFTIGRAALRHGEKGIADAAQSRRMNHADIAARIAECLRLEVIAVGQIDGLRYWKLSGRHQRMAVAVDDRDALELRHLLDDAIQPIVQTLFVGADIVVRHAAHDLVDLGEGAIDALQHPERVLVQNIE